MTVIFFHLSAVGKLQGTCEICQHIEHWECLCLPTVGNFWLCKNIEDCECLCLFTIGKLETMSTMWSAVSVCLSITGELHGTREIVNIQNIVSLSLRHWWTVQNANIMEHCDCLCLSSVGELWNISTLKTLRVPLSFTIGKPWNMSTCKTQGLSLSTYYWWTAEYVSM